MKTIFAHFSKLLLIVSFAFYGVVAVAGSNNTGVFMEICADGVAKTVRVDANGNTADPAHDCTDCATCCLQIGAALDKSFEQIPTVALLELKSEIVASQVSVPKKRGICPNPRGPPLTKISGLIPLKIQSDGRPPLKDATA